MPASPFDPLISSVMAKIDEDAIDDAFDQLKNHFRQHAPDLHAEIVAQSARHRALQLQRNAGTITYQEYEAGQQRIRHWIIRFVNELPSRGMREQSPKQAHVLSPEETRARSAYLKDFKEDIENRLNVSIHQARVIDLGLEDTPAAVNLPWRFKDTRTVRTFDSCWQAVETYGRRLLVLGAPGSGKTVTLQHIARNFIAEAEDDPAAPIPLLVNLSKLDVRPPSRSPLWPAIINRRSSSQTDKRIELWLAGELARNPHVGLGMAAKWIAEGRIAALLDGLDEVDDEYRAELAAVLNNTYLRDHPDSAVVICSRINEYQPIEEDKATVLQLRGSITLQPLTGDQIADYLDWAGASGLRQALLNDETLYQIAQTPLTLTMLTLAYGGAAPTDIPSSGSLIERRHELMKTYVARMLQRKARRDSGIPFDDNPRNDVPVARYPYAPEKVDRYLGWLALRLSVRMQTAFSPHAMFAFLRREIGRDPQPGVLWAMGLARAPLMLIVAVLAGFAVAPATLESWRLVLLFGLGGMAICTVGTWVNPMIQSSPTAGDAARDGFKTIALVTLMVAGVAAAGITLGAVSLALSSALHQTVPPVPAGILVLSFIAVLVGLTLLPVAKESKRYIALLVVGSLLLFAVGLSARVSEFYGGWYIFAAGIAAFQVVAIGRIDSPTDGARLREISGAIAAITVLVVVAVASASVISPPSRSIAVLLLTGAVILAVVPDPLLALGALIAAFLAGVTANGGVGAAFGEAAYGAAALAALFLTDGFQKWPGRDGMPANAVYVLSRRMEEIGDRCWLSPVLFAVLGIMRFMPIGFTRFSGYAVSALVLKQSGGDIEFMHRLLRDYFALRDLQPVLASPDVARRIEAVRSLGFQGDAAITALGEYVRHPSPEIREAAAWALGRAASPEAVQHIEQALTDSSGKVRAAAVLSTRNLTADVKLRLLQSIFDDEDSTVQRAIIDIACTASWEHEDGHSSDYRKMLRSRSLESIEFREVAYSFIRTGVDWLISYRIISLAEELKDRGAVPVLIEALQDRRFSSRPDAARALVEIGDPSAAEALRQASVDADERVREAAQGRPLFYSPPPVRQPRKSRHHTRFAVTVVTLLASMGPAEGRAGYYSGVRGNQPPSTLAVVHGSDACAATVLPGELERFPITNSPL